MTSGANHDGEKTRDIELNIDDKQQPLLSSKKQHSMMRHFLFTIFAIGLFMVGICSTSHANARVPRSPTHRDRAKFQELLDGVEPTSLHDVLHEQLDKYKHGVFQEDKVAIVAVHQEAPEVATSLVELAKRQTGPSGNSTLVTTTTAVTTESTSTVISSITSSTIVTPSSESSSTPVTTSSSETTAPPTTTPTPTPTSSIPPTTTPLPTSKGSPTNISSSPTSTLPLSGSNLPIESSESESNPQPTSQPVTSLQIYTTTLPNGKASTVTQTTVVPAGQPDQTGAAGQSSKTNPIPSLQTNGGTKERIGVGAATVMIMMVVFIAS